MIILPVDSEQYGTYNQECVGVLDFPLMADTLSPEEWVVWADAYHPRSYRGFSSWGLKLLAWGSAPDFVQTGYNIYALMVATQRCNLDWDPSGTRYQAQIRPSKAKRLPVAATDKDVLKWQSSLSMLLPKHFHAFTNMSELQALYL